MDEITIAEFTEKIRHYHKRGFRWHFHMLTPNCIFNENKDKHAFFLENESGGEQFAVHSKTEMLEQGKAALKLLYSEEVFEETEADEGENPNFQLILERAEALNAKGVAWHHHLLFPNCVFNEQKGKWGILFEDSETGKIIKFFSRTQPKKKLEKIERLFYAQKA